MLAREQFHLIRSYFNPIRFFIFISSKSIDPCVLPVVAVVSCGLDDSQNVLDSRVHILSETGEGV